MLIEMTVVTILNKDRTNREVVQSRDRTIERSYQQR